MARLTQSENMLNEIFDFLPGGIIVHKIGLLNKRTRHALTKLELFGSARIIKLKLINSGFQKCHKIKNSGQIFDDG